MFLMDMFLVRKNRVKFAITILLQEDSFSINKFYYMEFYLNTMEYSATQRNYNKIHNYKAIQWITRQHLE